MLHFEFGQTGWPSRIRCTRSSWPRVRSKVLESRFAETSMRPVPFPQPLCLTVAHAHQLTCIHPSQFSLAHLCPPQSDLLFEVLLVLLGGHFYRGQKGTLSLRFNTLSSQKKAFSERQSLKFDSGGTSQLRRPTK